MLKLSNVSYTYANADEKALKSINAAFDEGKITAVLGESGSGKTTMLNCIARFIKPQEGEIILDGKNVLDYNEKEFRQRIGVVFQELHLFPHMTVLENLVLAPVKVLEKGREEAEKKAHETLERLGISQLEDSYPSQISGGQAQRVAIARALIMDPEFLLLDEPTAALDINTTDEFARWLLDLRDFTTFIVVTHDIPYASKVAQAAILVENGEIKAQGEADEIIDNITSKENGK